MKGTRMCMPASRTPENFPRRSTTKAFCCGTTTTILKKIQSANSAPKNATMKRPGHMSHPLFAAHPERQAVHALDPAALALRDRGLAAVPRAPRGAPVLDLPDRSGRQVLESDGDLLGELVDRLVEAVDVQTRLERTAQHDQREGRDDAEQDPLDRERPAHIEGHQHSDHEPRKPEEKE